MGCSTCSTSAAPPAPVPSAPAAGTGDCLGPALATSKAAYTRGEPITITFANGPGHAKDWIGVFPRGITPAPPSTVFSYVGGANHVPAGGRTDGTVTLTAASANKGSQWPLGSGHWIAWFMVDDGFTTVASADFPRSLTRSPGDPCPLSPAPCEIHVVANDPREHTCEILRFDQETRIFAHGSLWNRSPVTR